MKNAFLGSNNCTILEKPIQRNRHALDSDETLEGSFLVWQVLGFGGRPSPLLYARMVSILCNTGKDLLKLLMASTATRGV